jgi:hypothetical protein
VVLAGDREEAPDRADGEVLVRVDVLGDALEDPVGQQDQQRAEDVDDELELLEEREAAEDRQAAQDEREDDAEEQQPRPQLDGHAEVAEQQQEDEQVVERERALDEVDRRVLRGLRRALGDQQHDAARG